MLLSEACSNLLVPADYGTVCWKTTQSGQPDNWKSIANLQQNWQPQPPGWVIHICPGSCQHSLKLMLGQPVAGLRLCSNAWIACICCRSNSPLMKQACICTTRQCTQFVHRGWPTGHMSSLLPKAMPGCQLGCNSRTSFWLLRMWHHQIW